MIRSFKVKKRAITSLLKSDVMALEMCAHCYH
jgi:hypothetical protein